MDTLARISPEPARRRSRRGWFLSACLVAFVPAGAAFGATYYFSDCAKGGAGTQASPWCLDPDGDGLKQSIEYLMDGSTPEVAAGDTIYLCAGACDAAGSATYRLDRQPNTDNGGDSYVIDPQVSGAAGAPITIMPWPGETIVLSADSDHLGTPGAPDASDANHLITNDTNVGQGKSWYVWKNLTFERTTAEIINLPRTPNDWTFDGCEFRRTSSDAGNGVFRNGVWRDLDLYIPNSVDDCTAADTTTVGYGIKAKSITTNFTVRNSRLHHLCGFAFRITTNPNAGSIRIENNTIYNTRAVTNDYDSRNVTYSANYAYDNTEGISIEDRMHDVKVEDNTIACLGQYRLNADGSCRQGVHVDDGDMGTGGNEYNIFVRRNRIFGAVSGTKYGGKNGWMKRGIEWEATCQAARGCAADPANPGYVIENNMVWYVGCDDDSAQQRGGISVASNSPVLVQNNTVYYAAETALVVSPSFTGDPAAAPVTHTIRNNLLVKAYSDLRQKAFPVVVVYANATGSLFQNNNIHDGGTGSAAIDFNGSLRTCAQVASFGTANKCSATTFVSTSGAVDGWDLHLPNTDTANKNAGTSGPQDDIDKQTRQSPLDIGADELVVTDSTPPAAPTRLQVITP